jgi:hypothetical protein
MSHYTDDPTSALNLLDDPAFIDAFARHGENVLHGGVIGTIGTGQPLATFSHDCRQPPMSELEEAIRFYDDNYDMIRHYFLGPTTGKIYLGTKTERRCRFCGLSWPDVTFRKDAHAIPECLGNKSLRSYYECDDCNQLFGAGIENDFGAWSLPIRTMARIRGKKGYPAIKVDHAGAWRIEATSPSHLIITGDDNPSVAIDHVNKEINLDLCRGDHTPVAVVKALVKMGLTILPDEEMSNFQQALAWIRNKDHVAGPIVPVGPVVQTFVPGPAPSNFIALMVWRRKHDSLQIPYASFVLNFANEMIQVFLPSPERDGYLAGKRIRLYRFPNLSELGFGQYGPTETIILDMSGSSIVKGAVVRATSKFDVRIHRDAAA